MDFNKKNYFKLFFIIIIIIVIFLLYHNDLDVDNELFTIYNNNDYLNKYTMKNFFTQDQTKEILKESDIFAKKNGWMKTRHNNYPTTDNEITQSWNSFNMINNYVKNKIFPFVQKKYKVKKSKLRLSEIFIVRYSIGEGEQDELEYHIDHSDFSFIVSLNDDYTGGGTHFYSTNDTVKLDVGDCLIFSGKNKHKGNKIFSGQRYILAGFIFCLDGNGYNKIFIYETKKKIYLSIIVFIIIFLSFS
jgi:hypothetical protein